MPASFGRDEAIRRLAAAVISEPALRVIETGAGLALDASRVPELFYSAEAFGDETVVREAISRRRASPWLDFTPVERNDVLATVQAVLIETLATLCGASGGARLKVHLNLTPKGGVVINDDLNSDDHETWIVKFRALSDPVDIGPVKEAYV